MAYQKLVHTLILNYKRRKFGKFGRKNITWTKFIYCFVLTSIGKYKNMHQFFVRHPFIFLGGGRINFELPCSRVTIEGLVTTFLNWFLTLGCMKNSSCKIWAYYKVGYITQNPAGNKGFSAAKILGYNRICLKSGLR